MDRFSVWLTASVLAGAVCVGSEMASAQTTYHAAWSKIETPAWSMTPIYAEKNALPVAVDSFLAIVNPTFVTGDNLVAVWYSRDGTRWSAKSFDTNDPWEAVKAVKGRPGHW